MKRNLFLIILCATILTGCWDRRELNSLGIIYGVAIDKDANTGKFLFTAQLIRAGALQKQGATQESPVEIITTEGDTIFEAIRNITLQFDRKAFFPHNKIIIINEEIAKEGLLPILDLFMRDHELRKLVWIVIAKDTPASQLLGIKHGIGNIQATYLEDMIKMNRYNSEVTSINLIDFYKKLSGTGINAIAGVMKIKELSNFPIEQKTENTSKAIMIIGTAVFKEDKLIGYFDNIETRGLNWITGMVDSGIINVPSLTKGKLIAIEIKGSSSSIKPKIIDGEISFTIEVNSEGFIGEHEGTADISDIEVFEEIEKEQQKAIENEIELAIDKAQKELHSDVFGFGNALYKKYPKEWDKIKDDWDDIFPSVAYTLKVNAKLRKSGTILESIKSEE